MKIKLFKKRTLKRCENCGYCFKSEYCNYIEPMYRWYCAKKAPESHEGKTTFPCINKRGYCSQWASDKQVLKRRRLWK